MDKQELRTILLARRNQLSITQVRSASALIASRLQASVSWQNVTTLHMYRSNPIWNEVDTSWVEAFAYAMWPKVSITIGDISKSAVMPNVQYDVILVPMVGFDERRNRLGLGGGWYDRFLASQPQAAKIGIAYDIQKVAQLRVEPHDIPLDMIVTETAIFKK